MRHGRAVKGLECPLGAGVDMEQSATVMRVWRRALVDRCSGATGFNQGAMNATLSP